MSLSEWEQEVKVQGWSIDILNEHLKDVWAEAECDCDFNDAQRSLLCLALLGHSPATAAGKLIISTKTRTEYCSKGLFKGLNQLYKQNPKGSITKIKWNDIQSICKEMGYLDSENSDWKKFINYIEDGRIDLTKATAENNLEVIQIVKKLLPKIELTIK